MFKYFKRSIILLFILLFNIDAKATHLIGGDISFEHTDSTNFLFTLNIYRDCSSNNTNNTNLDNFTFLVVYDPVTFVAYDTIGAPLFDQEFIDNFSTNPCVDLPDDLCIEKGEYQFNIQLPPNPNGYLVSYQRCCFGTGISNINQSFNKGMNIYTLIKNEYLEYKKSSPKFNLDPPLTFCNLIEDNQDFSSSIADTNLNVTHSLVTSFRGANPNQPTENLSPPFSTINFSNGYNTNYPWDASPAFVYDSLSGYFSGTPNELGYFLMTTKASVIDTATNTTLCEVTRTFRYLVSDCNLNFAEIALPEGVVDNVICGTKEVSFKSLSTSSTDFIWHFGDSVLSPLDSSFIKNPTFTFSDWGEYKIKLVTMKNVPECTDSVEIDILIADEVHSTIVVNDDEQCLYKNKFDFYGYPDIDSNYVLEWDFGPTAVNQFVTGDFAQATFTDTGYFPVTLTTNYYSCSTEKTVIVHVREINLSSIIGDTTICLGGSLNFKPSHTNQNFTYEWKVNNQTYNTEQINNIQFNEVGKQVVLYTVIDNVINCKTEDSLIVHVIPFEIEDYKINSTQTNLTYYQFITNAPIEDDLKYEWTVNGKNVGTEHSLSYTFNTYGEQTICQKTTNADGCFVETCTNTYISYNSFFMAPNAFSPNGDNNNDIFIPKGRIMDEPNEYDLKIYNRWGKLVFHSTNETIGWDGLDTDGNECANANYVWVVDIRNDYEIVQDQGVVFLTN